MNFSGMSTESFYIYKRMWFFYFKSKAVNTGQSEVQDKTFSIIKKQTKPISVLSNVQTDRDVFLL